MKIITKWPDDATVAAVKQDIQTAYSVANDDKLVALVGKIIDRITTWVDLHTRTEK
jgi:hypothetical protein